MSDIQKAMGLLIGAFHKYSGAEGDKNTLNKGEMKEMLNKEFGGVLGNASDKAALDKIFKDLDHNNDGSVDFTEFCTLVVCVSALCNEHLSKK